MDGISSALTSGAAGFTRATSGMAAAAAEISAATRDTVTLSDAAKAALNGTPPNDLEHGIVSLDVSKYRALANLGTIRGASAMFDSLLDAVKTPA